MVAGKGVKNEQGARYAWKPDFPQSAFSRSSIDFLSRKGATAYLLVSLMLRRNWRGFDRDRAGFRWGEQRAIAVAITFEAGGIVALALCHGQLANLRSRQLGVVTRRSTVPAIVDITFVLPGLHRVCLRLS